MLPGSYIKMCHIPLFAQVNCKDFYFGKKKKDSLDKWAQIKVKLSKMLLLL